VTLIKVAMNDATWEDPSLVGVVVATTLPPDPDPPVMPLHLSSKQQSASHFFMFKFGSVMLQADSLAVSHVDFIAQFIVFMVRVCSPMDISRVVFMQALYNPLGPPKVSQSVIFISPEVHKVDGGCEVHW